MNSIWDWTPSQPARIEQKVGLLPLTGRDTLRFLHGQTSAAVEQATPGRWISTCCIGPTGRMQATAEVLVGDGMAWLVITAGDAEAVRQSLDRVLFPADQVTLGPLETALLISPVDPPGAPPAKPTHQGWTELPGHGGWRLGGSCVLRTGHPPMGACPPELTDRPLLSAGEQERWRIQQGVPAVPGELNADTNPFELGLADRVSLNKGCYVGQETLAKLATYDGVKQQLRRWHSPGPNPSGSEPRCGQVLIDPAHSADGRQGMVTTAMPLASGDWIGLALVRRRALDAEQLLLKTDGGERKLHLSHPTGFVPPPVGSGDQPS